MYNYADLVLLLRRWNAAVERIRQKVPDPVLRYAVPLLCLALLTGIMLLCLRTLGPASGHPVIFGTLGLLFIILLLGAPWLGYGPGLTICFLMIAISRMVGTSPRTLGRDAVRGLLTAVICLLISRLGQTSRRRVTDLRKAAADLEIRVRERTEDAVRAAEAMREALVSVQEQAQLLDLAYDGIL